MKQKISISVALIILFNLSVGVFAQSVPNFKTGNGNYPLQFTQAKTATQPLVLAAEEQRREQEIVSSIGLNPTEYRKAIEQYAKKNKIDINDIDISASYKTYSKEIIKYNNDYKALIKVFEGKTYNDVLTDANSFLGKKEEIVKYNGKEYNKVALFHAALHNLATRTKTGYLYNGTWIFKTGQEAEFGVKEKVAVMDFMYKVISNDGYYPKDEEVLYKIAKEVVSNGKPYFKSTEQHKDETHDAKGVVSAISLLTALSNTSARKQESAQVIYDLSKNIMRKELGAMGILSGSEALLALNTEDSLNKLYTLLADDLYRGWGTELALYFVETFSVEELQQRLAGFASEVNNGLGQYYNAIARRYVYVDPDKNSYDQKRLAEKRDETLATYSKVIYTDIFEQIGKEIGKRTKDPKVAKLASRLATKYYTELNDAKQGKANTIIGQRADSPLKRETKIHASLIVGILATAKVSNENLTKAAKVIYNGNWWDINEITQRDKNNIAATYLKLAKKPFNQRKQDMYALTIRTKNVAKFLDVYAQSLMLGKMIISMPAMLSKISNWARNAFKWVKMKPVTATNTAVAVRPVEAKPATAKPAAAQPAEVKPVEVKPIEIKPIEVKPIQLPRTPAPIEPVKLPSVAEPVKVPAAQVSQVAPKISAKEMATITQNVKWDILSKYYQRPAAMMIGPFIDLPFGLSGIGKNITFLLTNRHFLSKAKIEKVKAIVEEAALSVVEDINNGKIITQSEATNLVKERALAKIQASDEFTAKDVEDLTGKKQVEIVPVKQTLQRVLLTKYYQRPSNMVLNKLLSPMMGNPILFKALNNIQSGKIYKVIEEAAAEITQEVSAGKIAEGDIEAALRERTFAKIQASSEFTAEEKAALTGKAEVSNTNSSALAPQGEIELNPSEADFYAPEQNIIAPTEPSTQVAQGKVPANVKAEVVVKQKAKKHFKQYKRAYSEARVQEAYENINEAIKYDGKNAAYYHERAMLEYYNLDNPAAAIEDMKTAAKLNPGNRRYKVVLDRWNAEIPGEVKRYMDLYKKAKAEGNNQLASEYLNKALALDRDAATSYYNGIEPHLKVSEVDPNIQKTTNKVQKDILGQYGKKPLLMAAFPVNFFGVSERIMAFLTNSPYLSATKQAKVKVMIAYASAEVAGEIVTGKIPESEMEAAVKERAIEKILKSRSLTVQEKFDITTSEVSNLSTQEKLANYIENIKKAEDLRDSRLALKYLQEAIKLDPNNVYLYNRSYHAHYSLGQYEKAMQDLDKLKELEPSNPSHYANSFYLNYEHLHNFDQAWKDISEAIKINPTNSYYYRLRGMLAERCSNLEQAMRDMKMALKYNPNDDFCLHTLENCIARFSRLKAIKYNKMTAVDGEFGKIEKILDEYNKGLTYWSKDRAENSYKQALRAEEQGNIDKALQEIHYAISENPYVAKYQELSYQLNYSTNPQQALENISDAIELDPINAKYYAKRAEIEWYKFEDFESAIADMKTAARYDSGYQKGLESFQNMYKKRIVNEIKNDILGQYNQTPLMMAFFPSLSRRLTAILTNRPYLSLKKKALVNAIVDEAAAEVFMANIPSEQAASAIKEKTFNKIKESNDFTPTEKETLTSYISPQDYPGRRVFKSKQNISEDLILKQESKAQLAQTKKQKALEKQQEQARQQVQELALESKLENIQNKLQIKAEQELAAQKKEYSKLSFKQQLENLDKASKKAQEGDAVYKKYIAGKVAKFSKTTCKSSLSRYDEAIALNPNNSNYYISRAKIKIELGDYQGAMEDVFKAAILNKNIKITELSKMIRYSQAVSAENIEQARKFAKEAEAFYQKYITKKPSKSTLLASFNRYNEALNLDPMNKDYYLGRAKVRLELGYYQGALEDLNRVANLDKINRDIAKSSLAKTQEISEAEPTELKQQTYEAVRKAQKEAIRADIAAQEAEDLKFEEEVAKKVEIKQTKINKYQRIIALATEQDNWAKVARYYTKVINLDGSATNYYRRAEAYVKKGQLDLAREDYKKALELDPRSVLKDSHIFDGIKVDLKMERARQYIKNARNFMNMGDNLKAIDEIEMALRNNPANKAYQTLLEEAKEAATAEEYHARALENIKLHKYEDVLADYNMAVAKASDRTLKAQYLFEQARFLRYRPTLTKFYVKGIWGAVSYSRYYRTVRVKYNEAVEAAPTPEIKAQYLLDRAEFKRYSKDFEGSQADIEEALRLDPNCQIKATSLQQKETALAIKQARNKVRNDILGKYEQTPLMASFVHMFLPVNVFKDVGKYLSCFLTNRPYLSSAKIAKVEALLDEAAAELSAEGIETYDIEAAMKERVIEKINNSSDFSAKEKEQLTSSYKNAGKNEKEVSVNNVFYFDGTVLTSISSEVRPVIPSNITPEVIAKQKAVKSYKKFKKETLKGNVQGAFDAIDEAIRYYGKNGDYYYERAMIEMYDFKNQTAAIEDMKQACRYSPYNKRYRLFLDSWTEEELKTKKQKLPAKIKARKARADEAREAQRIAAENERIKAENARLREEAKKAKLAKQREEIYKARMQGEAYLKAEEEHAIRKKNQEIYERAKAKEEQIASYQEILEGKIEAGDYEGAIPYYTEVLNLEESAATYYQRAKAYLKTGQNDLAKADYKKGVELDPKNELREEAIFDGIKEELKLERGDKYSQKAQFFMDMGDNFQAIDELEMALRNNPKNAEYKALLKKAKESITAEEYYAKALEYKQHGKNQNTYEYFELAIGKAEDPALKAQYLYEEARFLQYAKGTGKKMTIKADGRYITYQQAALRSYDRAIKAAPTPEMKAQYLLERAKLKRINKDFEGAKADIEKAKKLDPNLK